MKLFLILPLPISVNSLYQNQSRFNPVTRSYQLTGKRVLSKAGAKLKEDMAGIATLEAKKAKWSMEELGDRHVYMDVVVYFNRKGRDSDNLFKQLQDSMQGVIYKNDSQVLPRVQKMMYDTVNPRVEVTFTPVEYVGIFNDFDTAEKFEDNCITCSRYRKGRCSILVDSLSGTVREEISSVEEPVCSEYKEKKK